ncbi:MAG: antibiotic biosynthesis monooxygenase [Rhodospirillales bacterium]
MDQPTPVFDGPHFAVIFTTRSRNTDNTLYLETAEEMERLAAEQPGYLGIDSARSPDGLGITVSYWRDLDAIAAWRDNTRHKVAQQLGRDKFYELFTLRIARVEHGRAWEHSG